MAIARHSRLALGALPCSCCHNGVADAAHDESKKASSAIRRRTPPS